MGHIRNLVSKSRTSYKQWRIFLQVEPSKWEGGKIGIHIYVGQKETPRKCRTNYLHAVTVLVRPDPEDEVQSATLNMCNQKSHSATLFGTHT